MNKEFVNRYLMENGKYFPSSKLNVLGKILEDSTASEYAINKRFFSPLLLTIIFWVFWPFQLFDRLFLKDWFWGILKLITPLIIIYVLYQNRNVVYFGEEKNDPITLFCLIAFVLWGIWTMTDGFTIYKRTKIGNYRSVLRALNVDDGEYISRLKKGSRNELTSPNLIKSSPNNNFEEWRKNNPTGTLNDFYRQNGR